jgi:hypothetical protein
VANAGLRLPAFFEKLCVANKRLTVVELQVFENKGYIFNCLKTKRIDFCELVILCIEFQYNKIELNYRQGLRRELPIWPYCLT